MKKTIRKRKRKNAALRPSVILFATVSPSSKLWLTRAAKAKPGKISRATMLEQILQGLRRKPQVLKQLGV